MKEPASGRRLEILLEAARLLSFSIDLYTFLRKLVALIYKTMKVEIISIMLKEECEEQFKIMASRGLPRTIQRRMPLPLVDRSIAGWVARTGKPLLIKDLDKDKRFQESSFKEQYSTTSLICLPLKVEGKVHGIMSVNNKKDGTPFDEEDLNLLSIIAEQASMVLDKALLHQRVTGERDRIAQVNKLATSLMTTLRPGPLKRKTLTSVCRLLNAQGSSLLLYDAKYDVLRFAAAVGPGTKVLKDITIKPEEGLAGWVLTHGKSVLIRDAQKDDRFWPQVDIKTGLTTNSLIAVPLLSREKVIGVLEVINRTDGDDFTETDRQFAEMIAAVVSLALDNNLLYQQELRFHRRLQTTVNNRTRELLEANRRLRILLEEKEALKLFNEKIINNLASGLVTFDEKGQVTTINPKAVEILNLQEGKPDLSLELLFGESFARCLLKGIRPGKIPRVRDEVEIKVEGDFKKILGYTLSRMRYPQKGYAQGILLFSDLTEVKRMEEEMKRLDRLVSLGEISAQVAHELRNPLTIMYSSMDFLSMKISGEHQELIRVIIENMERMETITRRMALLSREMPLQKKWIDLRELTSQSLFFLDKTFRESKVEASSDLPSGPVWVKGDLAQLQQALFNLLINAVQAMEGGGKLEVQLLELKRGKKKTVSLTITDNGPGISPELSVKIFDPFFTTKESGTGLGLPIVHRIVRRHEGKIRVSNRPGGGAVFQIEFPCSSKGKK